MAEVKPCPFCGNQLGYDEEEEGYLVAYCRTDNCIYEDRDIYVDDFEQWNNAWAHRRIAELESALKRLGEPEIQAQIDRQTKRIAELEAVLETKSIPVKLCSECSKQIDEALNEQEQD